MTHHIIYLPGLGDSRDLGQKKLLRAWQRAGVVIHYQPIGWADGGPFGPKLERLSAMVDDLKSKGECISVVGISAGASAALNLYAIRKESIDKVVFVCGKLKNPQAVSNSYYRKNPAFKGAMELLSGNLKDLTDADKAKMLSIHPVYDNIVPVADTKIDGVQSRTILSAGHIPTIFLVLLLYHRSIVNFLTGN